MSDWSARPVFFAESVERSVAFYTERRGVTERPSLPAEGRMFISLETGEWTALKAEFEERGAPVEEGWRGSAMMIVRDPDGNQLVFPDPDSQG